MVSEWFIKQTKNSPATTGGQQRNIVAVARWARALMRAPVVCPPFLVLLSVMTLPGERLCVFIKICHFGNEKNIAPYRGCNYLGSDSWVPSPGMVVYLLNSNAWRRLIRCRAGNSVPSAPEYFPTAINRLTALEMSILIFLRNFEREIPYCAGVPEEIH